MRVLRILYYSPGSLQCDYLLISGQITDDERDLRNNAYWTFYQQDVVGIGQGPVF